MTDNLTSIRVEIKYHTADNQLHTTENFLHMTANLLHMTDNPDRLLAHATQGFQAVGDRFGSLGSI